MFRYRPFFSSLAALTLWMAGTTALPTEGNAQTNRCDGELRTEHRLANAEFVTNSRITVRGSGLTVGVACVENIGTNELKVRWRAAGMSTWVVPGGAAEVPRITSASSTHIGFASCLRYGNRGNWVSAQLLGTAEEANLAQEERIRDCAASSDLRFRNYVPWVTLVQQVQSGTVVAPGGSGRRLEELPFGGEGLRLPIRIFFPTDQTSASRTMATFTGDLLYQQLSEEVYQVRLQYRIAPVWNSELRFNSSPEVGRVRIVPSIQDVDRNIWAAFLDFKPGVAFALEREDTLSFGMRVARARSATWATFELRFVTEGGTVASIFVPVLVNT